VKLLNEMNLQEIGGYICDALQSANIDGPISGVRVTDFLILQNLS